MTGEEADKRLQHSAGIAHHDSLRGKWLGPRTLQEESSECIFCGRGQTLGTPLGFEHVCRAQPQSLTKGRILHVALLAAPAWRCTVAIDIEAAKDRGRRLLRVRVSFRCEVARLACSIRHLRWRRCGPLASASEVPKPKARRRMGVKLDKRFAKLVTIHPARVGVE